MGATTKVSFAQSEILKPQVIILAFILEQASELSTQRLGVWLTKRKPHKAKHMQ